MRSFGSAGDSLYNFFQVGNCQKIILIVAWRDDTNSCFKNMNPRLSHHCCSGPKSLRISERRERRNSTASSIRFSSLSRHLPTMNFANSFVNDTATSSCQPTAASAINGDPAKCALFASQSHLNSHSHAEPMFYFRGHPPELTSEFTARHAYIVNDEDPHSNGTTCGATALARCYELLQSYESSNSKLSNPNILDSLDEEPIHHLNKCCHKKCCNNTITFSKEDDYSKYVHKIKTAQALKNVNKGFSNTGIYISPIATTFLSVEVQTDPVPQRNVSQQTCFPTHKIASDETYNEIDYETNAIKKKNAIQSMLIDCGNITLNDVVGLEEAKVIIREIFVLPLTHPHLFNLYPGSMKRCSRCLLYGPPGTGKTLLAKAIASELGANLFYVSCAGILSCYIGQSEKNVRELFEYVLEQDQPSIIFFDEIDSVCRKRSESEPEHSRRLKTDLLKYFEWPAMDNSQVYIISATNCPWDLDTAFLRRFHRHIYIPMPERATRLQIMRKHLGDLNSILSEDDWNKILNETEGFSGSDLTNFISIALAQPNREILRATHWRYFDEQHVMPCDPSAPNAFQASLDDIPSHQVVARYVELADFLKAAQDTPKTVTKPNIEQFEKFKLCSQ